VKARRSRGIPHLQKKADQDGLPNIARLFRLTAQAEKIHAEGHFGSMDGVGSTVDNLKAAIDGETYEFTHMYPPMVQQAEKDGHKAKRMFHTPSKPKRSMPDCTPRRWKPRGREKTSAKRTSFSVRYAAISNSARRRTSALCAARSEQNSYRGDVRHPFHFDQIL